MRDPFMYIKPYLSSHRTVPLRPHIPESDKSVGFIPQRQQGPSTVHNLDDNISTPRHPALKKVEPFSSPTLRSVHSIGSSRNSFDNLFESLNFSPSAQAEAPQHVELWEEKAKQSCWAMGPVSWAWASGSALWTMVNYAASLLKHGIALLKYGISLMSCTMNLLITDIRPGEQWD